VIKIPDGILFQNDPRLPDPFRKEGCRAKALMAMSEIVSGKALTALQIELCISAAQLSQSIMSADCTLGPDEHKITEYAAKLLGNAGLYFRQTGVLKGDTFFDWSGSAMVPSRIAFTLLHWETDFPSGHYTLGDSEGKEIIDSWCRAPGFNPWDATGRVGYTIDKKRVVEVFAYSQLTLGGAA